MPIFKLAEGGVTIASLTEIASGIGSALTWFWTIFGTLMDTITSNPLILWSVAFAIVSGAVLLAIKVIRRFGIKSRR